MMASIDPDRPGRRLSGARLRSGEGQALASAFNGMLDRLESSRREAAARRWRLKRPSESGWRANFMTRSVRP